MFGWPEPSRQAKTITELFTSKAPPHYAGEIWKRDNHRPAILDLCLRKTWSGKSHDYRDVIVFEKLRFQNVIVHTKT